MTINEAAKLVANKTHAIYDDDGSIDTLRKVLSMAFPKDEEGKQYKFENVNCFYGASRRAEGEWIDTGSFLEELEIIKLSEITHEEKVTLVLKETQNHYDNSKGSLYQFCEDKQLNSYEFDIIKRIMRCRKKGQFKEDLEKTKYLIDLYLTETNH